jgi:hypothetical protein
MMNKVRQPELDKLVGIQMPKRYTRIFIDYLSDVQLTRLSFWLTNQGKSEIGSYRARLTKQEFDRRELKCPALWHNLPFDNDAQRAEWELWAATKTAKKEKRPPVRAKA